MLAMRLGSLCTRHCHSVFLSLPSIVQVKVIQGENPSSELLSGSAEPPSLREGALPQKLENPQAAPVLQENARKAGENDDEGAATNPSAELPEEPPSLHGAELCNGKGSGFHAEPSNSSCLDAARLPLRHGDECTAAEAGPTCPVISFLSGNSCPQQCVEERALEGSRITNNQSRQLAEVQADEDGHSNDMDLRPQHSSLRDPPSDICCTTSLTLASCELCTAVQSQSICKNSPPSLTPTLVGENHGCMVQSKEDCNPAVLELKATCNSKSPKEVICLDCLPVEQRVDCAEKLAESNDCTHRCEGGMSTMTDQSP
jgi:hypothetical protein